MRYPGLFVSVDGPNGVGKSTLIQEISGCLHHRGLKVFSTKEVTSSALGSWITKSVREYKGKTLAFLIAADRQSHIEQEIAPALLTHDVVITDRYLASSLVYQYLDGVPTPFIWKLNEDFLKPDLSVSLTASPELIARRLASRTSLDRFENLSKHEEEVRLFHESAHFLEAHGFHIYRATNNSEGFLELANELTSLICGLVKQQD